MVPAPIGYYIWPQRCYYYPVIAGGAGKNFLWCPRCRIRCPVWNGPWSMASMVRIGFWGTGDGKTSTGSSNSIASTAHRALSRLLTIFIFANRKVYHELAQAKCSLSALMSSRWILNMKTNDRFSFIYRTDRPIDTPRTCRSVAGVHIMHIV